MPLRPGKEQSTAEVDEGACNNDINVRKLLGRLLCYGECVIDAKRRPGRPSTSSLNDFVLAAVRVIDRVGLDGCTMRVVAEDLGVSPMTMYRHVKDKADLLSLIPDVLLEEVARDVIRKKRAISALQAIGSGVARVISDHPGTARLFDSPTDGPNITASFTHCAGLLVSEGFSIQQATSAIRAVVAQVIGEAITAHGATDPTGLRWLLDGIRYQLESGR
jgi:AcrR family transcriptional regulator